MCKKCNNCELYGCELCRYKKNHPCDMYEPSDEKKRGVLACIAIAITVLFVCLISVGCKTIYTPVDSHDSDSTRVVYRIDTLYKYTYDSVRIQMPCSDSISVAYVYRWHVDTIYKSVAIHDTIRVNNTDTIFQAVEVEKPVKYVPGYYHFTSWAFWVLLVIVILAIVIRVLLKVYVKK